MMFSQAMLQLMECLPTSLILRYQTVGSMLVMERLHGVPLTDLAAIRSITAADPETVLINALNTWC